MQQLNLEKWLWTDKDFDQMGWHDCAIYAIRMEGDIYFDLDYIFKWNKPAVEGMPFSFWIAPSTLRFQDVSFARGSFEMDFAAGLEIMDITKTNLNDTVKWLIETQEGAIEIHATSYEQVIKRPPTIQYSQRIDIQERGGINFSTTSEKDYVPDEFIRNKREEEQKKYELAILVKVKKNELQKLKPGVDKLVNKAILLRKEELQNEISDLTGKLKGSRFENW